MPEQRLRVRVNIPIEERDGTISTEDNAYVRGEIAGPNFNGYNSQSVVPEHSPQQVDRSRWTGERVVPLSTQRPPDLGSR